MTFYGPDPIIAHILINKDSSGFKMQISRVPEMKFLRAVGGDKLLD